MNVEEIFLCTLTYNDIYELSIDINFLSHKDNEFFLVISGRKPGTSFYFVFIFISFINKKEMIM